FPIVLSGANDARALRRRKRVLRAVGITAVYAVLLLFAAVFLLPFYWMIVTALKPQSLVYQFPPEWTFSDLTLENFRAGWTILPFGRFFLNTILVTELSVIGSLLSSSLVGFGFARYQGRGSNVLFVLVLLTMMVP